MLPRALLSLTCLILLTAACTTPEPTTSVPKGEAGGPDAGVPTSGAAAPPPAAPAQVIGKSPQQRPARETSFADGASGAPADKPAAAPERKPRLIPPEASFYQSREVEDLGSETDSGVKVYTNEDLAKLGMPTDEDEGDASAQAAWVEEYVEEKSRWDASRQAAERLIAQSRQRIREFQAEIDRLDKRAAALRNPLLPRVELTDEEKTDEQGLAAPSRLKQIEERREVLLRKIESERARIRSLTPQ
jgi:hypothetical protein